MRVASNLTRVVHIASGDLWAGAEAQLHALAKELNRSAEISLHVVLLNHGMLKERLENCGVEVTVLDETKLNAVQILYNLRRLLAKMRARIVHTHRQKENVLGSLAAFLLPNCRSMRTVHGATEFTLRPWQLRKMVYRLLDWFCGRFLQDRVVAVSDELGTLLARRFTARKVRVIQNGIDLDEVIRQSQLPVSLPGPAEAFKVAFVGRLVPVKRVDIFLEVAKALLAENADVYKFYIFGDGPLWSDLNARLDKQGLRQHVYATGFIEHLPPYLARMNLLLVTSDHEGLPMSVLEALSLDVPVVAHAVGGISRVLENGRYGILVRNQRPAEYVEAIRSYVAMEPYIQCTCLRSAHVADCYSVYRSASTYLQTYRDLLA
jgi:glycosyltransferase involved in cell wall biosynthesis